MNSYTVKFDGKILQRGFWVYIWKVTDNFKRALIYVGRTGDSSSPHAGSPFSRLNNHLDSLPKAKGNSLYRNLIKHGMDPLTSKFEMKAFGPFYIEQDDFEKHKPFRDKVWAIEYALYLELTKLGYTVIGTHQKKESKDKQIKIIVQEIIKTLKETLRIS